MAKKLSTRKKHNQICDDFAELYDKKRRRFDDIIVILAERHYMSTVTIERIIRKGKNP